MIRPDKSSVNELLCLCSLADLWYDRKYLAISGYFKEASRSQNAMCPRTVSLFQREEGLKIKTLRRRLEGMGAIYFVFSLESDFRHYRLRTLQNTVWCDSWQNIYLACLIRFLRRREHAMCLSEVKEAARTTHGRGRARVVVECSHSL